MKVTNITDHQKAELVNRVNKIIDSTSKPLKVRFFGGLPNLNAGKILKTEVKASAFLAGLLFGSGNLFSILFAYLLSQDSKEIFNKYNLTAAGFFPYAHYANFGQYLGERDGLINNNNKCYWAVGFLSTSMSLFSFFLLYLRKTEKKTLLIYKQWKKALKIRALIQGTMEKFQLLKSGLMEQKVLELG